MSTKLTTAALVALSVSALEAELEANVYTAEELAEAAELEKAGDKRKTALAALEDAATEKPEEINAAIHVCKGKTITTRAGIKSGGDEITAGMLPEASIELMLEKGYLEVHGAE